MLKKKFDFEHPTPEKLADIRLNAARMAEIIMMPQTPTGVLKRDRISIRDDEVDPNVD